MGVDVKEFDSLPCLENFFQCLPSVFEPACLSTCLQVLTPKDSAALSRSCEDAVAAEVEFMEEHKRNEKASNLNFIFVEGFVLHGVHLQNITRGRVCWIVNWNIFSQNSLTG